MYEDYAAQLVPRAVGYSAGLLNYFPNNFDFTVNVSTADPSKRLLTSYPAQVSAETADGTFTLYAEDGNGSWAVAGHPSRRRSSEAFAQTIFTPLPGARVRARLSRQTGQ